MIVRNVSKKDINTVLLKFYRKEKYCANLQLNVFYNMAIITNNINNLADSTKTRLTNILTKQKQIANVKHLLYGKIYDLYDEVLCCIPRMNLAALYGRVLWAQCCILPWRRYCCWCHIPDVHSLVSVPVA